MSLRRSVLTRLTAASYSFGCRGFGTARKAVLSAPDLRVSAGHDRGVVVQQATALVDGGKWQLCNGGQGLERHFQFKGFKSAWEFMNHVAVECKKQKHHPEWTNIYSKTHVRWTTHTPEGLSTKDTHMARFCDEAGKQFGELEVGRDDTQVTGEAKIEAGDCCVGEKASS